MGYSIAWIAFKDIGKLEALRKSGFLDTGEEDECNESPASGAQLPNSWYVIFLNDISHRLVSSSELQRLSQTGQVLACQIEEHVMASTASLYENGTQLWSISHESDKGIYNLELSGHPPQFFEELHARTTKLQDEEGGARADVDLIFDVPLEVAKVLCGYRHDECDFPWGTPQFTTLK